MSDLPRLITHKLYIFFYVFYVLNIFLGGVGIVETKITFAVVDLGLHEVKPHGLAVTDVKVAIGLWWESSQDNISELVDPILKQIFGVES